MTTFEDMVKAVEENNKINDASWKDWRNAEHMQEVYGYLHLRFKHVAEAFLNALIRDNGNYCDLYLDAFEALQHGIVFAR